VFYSPRSLVFPKAEYTNCAKEGMVASVMPGYGGDTLWKADWSLHTVRHNGRASTPASYILGRTRFPALPILSYVKFIGFRSGLLGSIALLGTRGVAKSCRCACISLGQLKSIEILFFVSAKRFWESGLSKMVGTALSQ
jgi:hypothetical protein